MHEDSTSMKMEEASYMHTGMWNESAVCDVCIQLGW